LLSQTKTFDACPNYNEWIGIWGSSESHNKAMLHSRVSTFCARYWGSLFGARKSLTLALLQLAQDQFTKMVGFINWFYQELTQVATFSKQPAWLLVGHCIGTVLKSHGLNQGSGLSS
jgi:hypothetical protein